MGERVGSLRIFTNETEDAQSEELPMDSTRYKIVQSIINQSLFVLKSPEGRESLISVATEIIKKRREKQKHHLYGDRPFSGIPTLINSFLDDLRSEDRRRGMTIKYDWGDDTASHDPKTAAELHLNRTILNNTIYAEAQNNINYNLLKFQMDITVAYEMIHILTGYLTGKKLPPRPPK